MDQSASDIEFDQQGICNYCRRFEETLRTYRPIDTAQLQLRLDEFVDRVKSDGKNKPYDCIVGISGGADSAYALYLAKKNGLRPLAVHMDNGWDSELAANNIENLVRKLDVDLHTHVINWQEYKQLMQALFDADVIDIELLYDNAMLAVNHQMAAKHGIKWILGGTNTSTEGMEIPPSWNWFKYDKKNIIALGQRANTKPKTFPTIGIKEYTYYRFVRGIKWVSFLDYINYVKNDLIQTIVDELGYRTYPYKHGESVFTRFYQGHILPTKFGVDKRKIHFSTLILSGQLDRKDAIAKLEEPPYSNQSELKTDIEYFLKKMGWTQRQLDEYLARPEISHAHYGTEKPLWGRLANLRQELRALREPRRRNPLRASRAATHVEER